MGFWYYWYVCFVMGAPVYKNVLNARWLIYGHGNLWKMIIIVGAKEEKILQSFLWYSALF